jgi:hypothetical protein
MPALFLFDHLILKANALTGYYKANNNNRHTTTKPQPYYKDKTMIQNYATKITNMSEDEQR